MIEIPRPVYDDIIKHCKTCYPQEACGFLAGEKSKVRVFIPIENSDHSTVSYMMDPRQQMRAFEKMNREKMELVGIVHSHVASPATPSQRDLSLAFYPDVSYVIVSLADMHKPDLQSWRIAEGRSSPDEVKTS